MTRTLEAIGGATLGALTGILVGMSSSPVVASLVGGIAAALTAFWGLRGGGSSPNTTGTSDLRVACFASACIVALLAGVYVRTHGSLSPSVFEEKPSLKEELDAWKAGLHLTEDQARSLVIYRRLRILPAGMVQGATETKPSYTSSTVFSQPVGFDCSLLAPNRYKSESERINAILQAIQAQAQPDGGLVRLQHELEKATDDQARKFILAGARASFGC